MRRVLVDTGPLVALLDDEDSTHPRCVAISRRLKGDFFTTWPVITEAAYLLSSSQVGPDALLGLLEAESLRVLEISSSDVSPMRKLMTKYRDQPMDLADASLVRVGDRDGMNEVFTLDGHFRIYRLPRNRPFIIWP